MNYNNLKQGFADVGIDFYKVANHLTTDTNGRPLTNIALNTRDARKSNPYLFVNRLDDGGFLYVARNHSGAEFIFKSNSDTLPAPRFNAPQAQRKKPKSNLFARAAEAWGAAGNSVSDHRYIQSKGVSVVGAPIRRGGFDLVAGGFDYRDCVILRLIDVTGALRGFQFIAVDGQKRYIMRGEGAKNGAFAVVGGDVSALHDGAIVVEGLATGLSVYHSIGNGRTTINNRMKRPVVVALDAVNLSPVFDALIGKFNGTKFELYADNDTKQSGNTGRFCAVELCHKFGLSGYYLPIGADGSVNVKVDFNETNHFKRIAASKGYELALDRVRYCNQNSLAKMARKAAVTLGDNIPDKLTVESAQGIIEGLLIERGADSETIKACINLVAWKHKKNVQKVEGFRRLTDLSGVEIFEDTGTTELDFVLPTKGYAIFDTRPMGKGKTQLMVKRVESLGGVGYIAPITALVDDATPKMLLDHYRDSDRYADRLGLCVNSLPKWFSQMRGVPLFVDEAVKVITTIFTSKTLEGRHKTVIDSFNNLLAEAPIFHAADANLNQFTLDHIKKHCPHLKIAIIRSKPTKHAAKHVLLPNHDAAKTAILDELLAGNSGVVACTSRDQAKALHDYLADNGIAKGEMLLIHGHNKADEAQADFLANVNTQAKRYRIIVHTGVLGSGISIVNEAFEFSYLLAGSEIPSDELMQLLGRNRCAKRVFVSFSSNMTFDRIEDAEQLKANYAAQIADYAADFGFDVSAIVSTELAEMRCAIEARQNWDLNRLERNFLILAELSGRLFERQSVDVPIDQAKAIRAAAAETKERMLFDVFNAPIINDVEYKKLSVKSALKQSESDSVTRFNVARMVGESAITLDDVKLYAEGYTRRLNNFLLITANRSELVKIDGAGIESGSGKRSLTTRQKVIKKVLKALGDDVIGSSEMQAACKVLKDHHAELGGAFGRIDKATTVSAGKTVSNFLQKIGIELVLVSRTKTAKSFALKIDDNVFRYANNRAGFRSSKGDCTAIQFLIKNYAVRSSING
jgi:hypothetical protein